MTDLPCNVPSGSGMWHRTAEGRWEFGQVLALTPFTCRKAAAAARCPGKGRGKEGKGARQPEGIPLPPIVAVCQGWSGAGAAGPGLGRTPRPRAGRACTHRHTQAQSDTGQRLRAAHRHCRPLPAAGSLRTMAPGLQLGPSLLALAACAGAARLAAGAAGGRRGPAEACAGRVSTAEPSGANGPGQREMRGFRGALQPLRACGKEGQREGAAALGTLLQQITLPWGSASGS